MINQALLTHYLSNLNIDLYMANYNLVTLEWQDLDYTPDYSKFYFICDGEGWIKIGDQEYYPVPGQLILMPEGVKQSYTSINNNPFTKYWCHFSVRVGDIPLSDILELPHIWNVADTNTIRTLFEELTFQANSDAVYAKLLAKSKLMELLSHFLMNIDLADIVLKNWESTDKLLNVLTYIHDNIEQEITIQQLAQVAFMHPNYFIRLFKRQMGVPPIQYITHKKIEKAKELLLSTPYSVTDIAHLVGFKDLFYFSKQFKKISGMPPTDFRKQLHSLI